MGNTHSSQIKRTFSKSSRHTISYGELDRIPPKEQPIIYKSRASSITEEETEEEEEEEKEEEDEHKVLAKNVLAVQQLQHQQRHLIQQRSKRPNAILTKIASLPPSPTCSHPSGSVHKVPSSETLIIQGRKYQNYNTKYILPADDQEQDRLVQCHFIYKYLYGGNFCAPVRDLLSGSYNGKPCCPKSSSNRNSTESGNWMCIQDGIPPPRVLDIACGNGTWILEMATEFPRSQFFGIDFLVNYPTTIKPLNTFFSQHDVLDPKGLPFPDNYFDYVFMRQVYTCFSESDWTIVVKEIKRVVKPGGYVEFRDIDPMLKNMGPHTYKLFKHYPRNMKKIQDVDISWARYMFDYLQDVGDMTDMHRQINALRFGSSGAIGNMIDNSLRSGFESYRLFFQRYNNYTFDEYSQIIDDVVAECRRNHSYFDYYSCWGRKPLLDYEHSTTPAASTMMRKQSGSTTNSGGNYSCSTATISNHDINPLSPPPATYAIHRHISVGDDDESYDELVKIPADFSGLTLEQGDLLLDPNDESEIADLGPDSKDDIDQFVEGFED